VAEACGRAKISARRGRSCLLAAFAPDLSRAVGPAAVQNLRVPSAWVGACGGEIHAHGTAQIRCDRSKESWQSARRTEIFALPHASARRHFLLRSLRSFAAILAFVLPFAQFASLGVIFLLICRSSPGPRFALNAHDAFVYMLQRWLTG
jgi:hypothetical protein